MEGAGFEPSVPLRRAKFRDCLHTFEEGGVVGHSQSPLPVSEMAFAATLSWISFR